MIELNNVTMHDFLNRKLVQELLDVGVDMSDATYYIYTNPNNGRDYIGYKETMDVEHALNCVPTYTIAQLHFKLHEHIYPDIDGIGYSGGLRYVKDAPFYIFYYDLKHGDMRCPETSGIFAEGETPIESLAYLLKQCHTKHTGIQYKDGTPCDDTGKITSKYTEYIWR